MSSLGDLADPWWRLNNLYSIITDEGQQIAFKPNAEQETLFRNLRPRNLICKARQLGFTTFVDLLLLDQCAFNRNFTGAILAHSLPDAARIFRTKVLGPYQALPEIVRSRIPLAKESASELVFQNGSSISVSTSVRSGTVQLLHVSEMAKIVRKYPERAREIVTGSFEAVPRDGVIIVESTAEGADGWFHDACMSAHRRQLQRSPETGMDWRLHFFPWNTKSSYSLDEHVAVPDDMLRYFQDLALAGVPLTKAQKAWYAMKAATMGDDIKREYPTTVEEAFARSMDGAIYGREMGLLRRLGRIGTVPVRPGAVVNTYWDLGLNDQNTIWLHQRVGAMNRFVRYFAGTNEGMRYYWNLIEDWRQQHDARWGKHYLPHDGDTRIQGYEVDTRRDILQDLGARDIVIVPRISDVRDGIELVRQVLPECEFDEVGCAEGVASLDNYSRDWNEQSGTWSSRPRHDKFCLGPDTRIRTLSGWQRIADLEAKENFYLWGYSEAERRLVPAKALRCWKSKRAAKIARVTLDHGKFIDCTPDHQFLTRDGRWVEAQHLQRGQSLMPMHERLANGYTKIHLTDGTIADEHRFVYFRLVGALRDGHHVHHLDEDKRNNEPANLRQMSIFEHRSLHSSTPEHLAHLRRIGNRTSNAAATACLVAVNKLRAGDAHHTRDPEYWTDGRRQKLGESVKRWIADTNRRKECPSCKEWFIGNWKRLYCCDNCKGFANSPTGATSIRAAPRHTPACCRESPNNHKVVKVELRADDMDVYDIEVDGIHSFVAEGVVVHNSHGADAFRQFAQAYKPDRGSQAPRVSSRAYEGGY